MRVVIDCNILVSAARSGGVCAKVVTDAIHGHEIVLSKSIVEEYLAVAERPAHAGYRDAMLSLVAELERVAAFVEPADTVFGLRDPDDEIYLATAKAGGAALVTGNSRDFTGPRYGPVKVFSPRSFIDQTD